MMAVTAPALVALSLDESFRLPTDKLLASEGAAVPCMRKSISTIVAYGAESTEEALQGKNERR